MKRPTLTRTLLLVPLVALSASTLTGCVAPGPYGTYGAQPQYAQPAYSQPTYAQPAYAPPPQPAYEPQPEPAYGQPPGGWLPDQRVSRIQALAGFTRGAAYAAFMENEVGTLKAGMRADFVILDGDVMTVPPR